MSLGVVVKSKKEDHVTSYREHSNFLYLLVGALFLFGAGIANCSVLALPYFIAFCALTVHACSMGADQIDLPAPAWQKFGAQIGTAYIALHLLINYLYQLTPVQEVLFKLLSSFF